MGEDGPGSPREVGAALKLAGVGGGWLYLKDAVWGELVNCVQYSSAMGFCIEPGDVRGSWVGGKQLGEDWAVDVGQGRLHESGRRWALEK